MQTPEGFVTLSDALVQRCEWQCRETAFSPSVVRTLDTFVKDYAAREWRYDVDGGTVTALAEEDANYFWNTSLEMISQVYALSQEMGCGIGVFVTRAAIQHRIEQSMLDANNLLMERKFPKGWPRLKRQQFVFEMTNSKEMIAALADDPTQYWQAVTGADASFPFVPMDLEVVAAFLLRFEFGHIMPISSRELEAAAPFVF